jgi:short-subunit dehydrogenase
MVPSGSAYVLQFQRFENPAMKEISSRKDPMENETNESHPLAVVTGASSGIGYALAKVFAKNGYNLIVCSDHADIADAGNAFRAHGTLVETVQADLATEAGVEKLYAKIRAAGQPLDAAVMNAGVGIYGDFKDADMAEVLNLVNLNLISPLRLTRKILPDFVARGEGKILYTSSIAAEMPGPHYAVYAASKSFLQSFAEAIRNEVKDRGVVVTSLQPGATDTNFFVRAGMEDTKVGQAKKDDPAEVAEQGFAALMAGKDHVVAGSFKNKVQAAAAKFMSDERNAKMHGAQLKPESPTH